MSLIKSIKWIHNCMKTFKRHHHSKPNSVNLISGNQLNISAKTTFISIHLRLNNANFEP